MFAGVCRFLPCEKLTSFHSWIEPGESSPAWERKLILSGSNLFLFPHIMATWPKGLVGFLCVCVCFG